MNLKEYFKLPNTEKIEMAYRCKIPLSSINFYIHGRKPCEEIAKRIELFTKGLVKVEDLRRKTKKEEKECQVWKGLH